MIIKTLLPIFLCLVFIGIAYTNFTDASKNSPMNEKQIVVQQSEEPVKVVLSEEDKKLIEEYNRIFDYLINGSEEEYHKKLKAFLPKVQSIKNNKERNNAFMNIYMQLGMYKEAYELNDKILKDSFSIERLILQCDLVYISKRSKAEYEQCYARLAIEFRKELKGMRRSDPEYAYSEWGYLLFMYKSGHAEYQDKLKKMLDSAKDEQMKLTFENLYVLAIEQVESYKKLSHD
ncbi:MAG: hypothetical protein KA288_08300 [Paludibacteraceae bacterium]|nr:hypothetical protein [Paludibacteraceae bacterium]